MSLRSSLGAPWEGSFVFRMPTRSRYPFDSFDLIRSNPIQLDKPMIGPPARIWPDLNSNRRTEKELIRYWTVRTRYFLLSVVLSNTLGVNLLYYTTLLHCIATIFFEWGSRLQFSIFYLVDSLPSTSSSISPSIFFCGEPKKRKEKLNHWISLTSLFLFFIGNLTR